jgi:hypothetical protein
MTWSFVVVSVCYSQLNIVVVYSVKSSSPLALDPFHQVGQAVEGVENSKLANRASMFTFYGFGDQQPRQSFQTPGPQTLT